MLHKFATFVAGWTVLLVLAGSLVTSTDSGLSVPDWPTSYGWNMFHVPAFDVGRWNLLRARSSTDRLERRVADDCARHLALEERPKPLDKEARARGTGCRDSPGRPRRPNGSLFLAGPHLDRSCGPCGNFLLPHRRHRGVHLAPMDRRRQPGGRCEAADSRDGDNGTHLPSDPHWRDHAPYERWPRHPGFSVDVRPALSRSLEPGDYDPLRASSRGRWS